MKAFFKWVGIIFGGLFVLGLIAGLSSGGKGGSESTSTSTAPAKTKEVVKINAQQLFAAYEENEVATDEGFKGKIIEVSGTVQAIDKDAFDNIVINLKTANQFMPAHMKMNDEEKAAAIAMKKGVKVAIQCQKMARIVGSPYGSDCRFIAGEVSQPVKKTAG